MSCASFIHVPRRPSGLPTPSKPRLDRVEDHAALIGLQALTLNLASANRESEVVQTKKKLLKPLRIPHNRKTPEKHVSISPLSATPRSAGSRFRASPCRSDSSGFQSLPSPASVGSDGVLFTNHSNVEVKTSESGDSLNTRASGSSAGGRTPRHNKPRSRQTTPQPRQTTPQPRQDTASEEYATVFDVQNVLRKGELVEGVLRFDRRSHQHAYISAPVNLGRTDGHLKWRGQ